MVRRTAEIFLCDADDWEVIFAKYGINGIYDLDKHRKIGQMLYDLDMLPHWWDNEEILKSKKYLTHRRMSNNSILFKEKPSREFLNLIFEMLQDEGEPGFINLEEAQRRRPNAKGLNPCSEVLLDDKQVCNLTTVNVMGFVKQHENGEYYLDMGGLLHAQALSVRAGMRMTLIDLELEEWDKKQKRDRLIGVSLTGWKDAMELLEYDEDKEIDLLSYLKMVTMEEKLRYANSLRIPIPLLDTTIKPEGTLSQVFGGVSNGLHVSHAPYYIRRIRINAHDPLVQVALELGWNVLPEVDTKGDTHEERMENALTYVVEFPVKSGAKKTKVEQTLEEQFNTYFMFQEHYTSHNSSNTINVKDGEWQKVEDIVFDKWDDIVGVSFIKHDGGTYQLMPYEEITEEEYNGMRENMKPFDVNLLQRMESEETDKDVENMESCDSGVCPIF